MQKNIFTKTKKSISPLIATILLIVVAVAIIAIIISWGKGFTTETLSKTSSLELYTESELGFYLNTKQSINGRVTFSYNPPPQTPYDSLTFVGYGLLGYTNNIVPLEPPVTILKDQSINIDHGIILPEVDLVLYLDNETMITKLNLKQEIRQPSSCPEGYVSVPGNHLYGTMNTRGGFCVMKWEAKTDANSTVQDACRINTTNFGQWHHLKTGTGYDCNAGSYNIVSTPENYPITNIRQDFPGEFDAIEACASTGGHLITNDEWMTIARNIELVPSNWSSGIIGEGYLPRGNSDNILVGNSLVYDGITPGTGETKRTLKLTNGQEVWDLAGNLNEWVDKTQNINYLSGCADNLDNCNFESISEYEIETEYSQLYSGFTYLENIFYKDLFLLNSDYNKDNGIGYFFNYFYDIENAFLRGGGWDDGASSGVLHLYLGDGASSRSYNFGLRCVQ